MATKRVLKWEDMQSHEDYLKERSKYSDEQARKLGYPSAEVLRLYDHLSQIAGKWRFGALRAWNRPGTRPGLCCWFVVEPPAGIEPATPSLPLMLGWFTTLCSISRPHTAALVRDAVQGVVVGRGEVTCSTVSGKFLARRAGRAVCRPGRCLTA